MEKAYFNWSSGKDSALALHYALEAKEFAIDRLITTVNTDFNRVSMHGLPVVLLEQQADSIGLPLTKIELAGDIDMKTYDQRMRETMASLKADGYKHTFFGDIFLEDLRKYREEKLAEVGIKAVFPLWKRNTKELLLEFLEKGYKTITVCINANVLDASFCGRIIDQQFIDDLPDAVDVCGENGEFHTFVFDGPIFKHPIEFKIGEKVHRSYGPTEKDSDDCFAKDPTWDSSFWYCDLIPVK